MAIAWRANERQINVKNQLSLVTAREITDWAPEIIMPLWSTAMPRHWIIKLCPCLAQPFTATFEGIEPGGSSWGYNPSEKAASAQEILI